MKITKNTFLVFLITAIHLWGCNKSDNTEGLKPIPDCKASPPYLPFTGIQKSHPFALSIAEPQSIGLSIVQIPNRGVPYKRFAFPSWSSAGHLGSVITDEEGASYVTPRPFINTLLNDPVQQNTIYKVNPLNGEMKKWVKLPDSLLENLETPFGLMGLAYDCENKLIYASTVFGSSLKHIRGKIYVLNKSGEILNTLDNVDAWGLGIAYFKGNKSLFFGDTRSGKLYRVNLDDSGIFEGEVEFVLDLSGLGDRGDDRVRKISFKQDGAMHVSGVTFNFNLANAPDKLENIYVYRFNPEEQSWQLITMGKGQQ